MLHPHTEVFEQLEVKILLYVLNIKPDLIVMDEFGHFESAALWFQTMVEACLESDNVQIPSSSMLRKRIASN